MKIYLNENLKRLRRENNLTQENLADFLGVTFQTVSNWERGSSYPDITMLPIIANYFKISIDELLGINKAEAEKKLEEYLNLYKNTRFKDTALTFEKYQQAIKDFPTDFRIIIRYMELLMCEKTSKEDPDYEIVSDELLAIYKNIQEHCTDDSIRMWSKRLICQHLHTKAHYTGNNEYQLQAEKIIAEMPNMIDSKDYLSTMLITDKEKHYDACSNAIENTIFFLAHSVDHFCLYDDKFSASYKIEALSKMLAIYNTIYTDGNYGKHWLDVIYNYGHLGHFYFELGNIEKAVESLSLCAKFAKQYDTMPQQTKRTAQFFEGRMFEKTARGKSMCERMKYLFTEKYPFTEEFKNTSDFQNIIYLLN